LAGGQITIGSSTYTILTVDSDVQITLTAPTTETGSQPYKLVDTESKMTLTRYGYLKLGDGAGVATERLDVDDNIKLSGIMKMTGITTVQKTALTAVAGDICYDTDLNKHQGYDGTSWNNFY